MQPRFGLVLSGGGSRGAYEAGVIRYIRERLPADLGHQADFDIITGTSVGAINASYLAATADHPQFQAERLCAVWRSLEIEQLISLRARDILRAVGLLLGLDAPPPKPAAYRYGGLLDTRGLERFVLKSIPWRGIRRNLKSGLLKSIALATTHIGSGHTVVFIDSTEPLPQSNLADPFIAFRTAHLGPRYALASAAIPMLFPAVKIRQSFYVDGGLRLNTPMLPAIRLGANRVLVISLRYRQATTPSLSSSIPLSREHEMTYPKPLFLAGKALNALMLDHTDVDLARLERLNQIIEAGKAVFGDSFQEQLNRQLATQEIAPVRLLKSLHIHPSQDIGVIAATLLREDRIKLKGRLAKTLLRVFARSEGNRENDLVSYLLFDGQFAEALIDLGYHDAATRHDELVDFFTRGN